MLIRTHLRSLWQSSWCCTEKNLVNLLNNGRLLPVRSSEETGKGTSWEAATTRARFPRRRLITTHWWRAFRHGNHKERLLPSKALQISISHLSDAGKAVRRVESKQEEDDDVDGEIEKDGKGRKAEMSTILSRHQDEADKVINNTKTRKHRLTGRYQSITAHTVNTKVQ